MATLDDSSTTSAELDAINDILASIGEPPVSALDSSSNADVANARRILSGVNKKIQSRGWTFNIEEGIELVPDAFSGYISWLPDFLTVMASSGATTYIKRGDYVYDTTNKTDVFTDSISVNMIRTRDYDEMPPCFRTWIVAQASRRFNMRFFGDESIDAVLAEEEQEARMMCNEYEMDYGQFNMLDGDTFVGGLISR